MMIAVEVQGLPILLDTVYVTHPYLYVNGSLQGFK